MRKVSTLILALASFLIFASCIENEAYEERQAAEQVACDRSATIDWAQSPQIVDDISKLYVSKSWEIGILSADADLIRTRSVRNLVIFLHGGPGSRRVPNLPSSMVGEMRETSNTAVASVLYSATELQNFSGTARLKANKTAALECDSLLLAAFIRSLTASSTSKTKVTIIGVSFGSIPALRVAAELGDDLDTLVIVSPWIFPLTIDSLIGREVSYLSDSGVVSPENRTLLKEGARQLYTDYMGFSEKMNGTGPGEKYLSSLRSEVCSHLAKNSLVFIAQHEDRADVQSTVDYFSACAGIDRVFTVESSFHGMELSFPWVQKMILDSMR